MSPVTDGETEAWVPSRHRMGQDRPPPSWGRDRLAARHQDGDAGDTLGGRVGGTFFPPAINICIFFFYPACTYSTGVGGGGCLYQPQY